MSASKAWGRKPIFLIVLWGSMVFLFRPVIADTVSVDLYVRAGHLDTVDGRSLPALCYTRDPAGNATLPAPIITVNRGDDLLVTLHNQDDRPHGFEVVGEGEKSPPVAPG